jgi:phosphoglycerate dehydrogenase-like enzyme
MKLLVHVHDLPMWSLPDAQVERIRQALPNVNVACARDYADARRELVDADVAIAPRMRPEALAGATRLQWVHTTAVGVDWLPREALAARDIPVTNTRGVHADMLAEHALALWLALRRHLPQAEARRRDRVWAQEELATMPTPRLNATTLVVVGLGAIGVRVARWASALGMTVIGVRRDLKADVPPGVSRVIGLAQLSELLPKVDGVVLALPHTAETGVVLDAAALARLKPGALIINVARGSLIDDAALVDGLRAGRIGGAGLDVFAREPLAPEHPLWTTPRTIITPHIGALDGDYWTPAIDFFLENWHRFVKGEPLVNVVDLARGY